MFYKKKLSKFEFVSYFIIFFCLLAVTEISSCLILLSFLNNQSENGILLSTYDSIFPLKENYTYIVKI